MQSRIASYTGVSKATVSRVLRRAGLSKFSDLAPPDPVRRYEREAPGNQLHIDIKKQRRFSDVGYRITGDCSKRTKGLGWEYPFVAVDNYVRVAFTDMLPDERKDSAESFLGAAVAYFARMRVKVQHLITDIRLAFHSFPFWDACIELGIRQKFTRAYRP